MTEADHDPSFEGATTKWSVGTDATYGSTTDGAADGTKSFRWSGLTSSITGRETRTDTFVLNVESGKQYRLETSWYGAGSNWAAFELRLNVEWFDVSNTLLSTSSSGTDHTLAAQDVWELKMDTFTAPANAVKAKILIQARRNNATTSGNQTSIDRVALVDVEAIAPVDHFSLSGWDPNLLDTSASRTVRRGQSGSLKITALDVGGNVVESYDGTVTLSVESGTISPTSIAFDTAWAGETTVTFTLSGDSAVGQVVITAEDGSSTGVTTVIPLLDNRIVVNEVLPADIAAGTDDRDEWIELYNRSKDDVSVNGWVIKDFDGGSGEINVSLPNQTIPSGDFLVIHTGEAGTDFQDDNSGPYHHFPFTTKSNRLKFDQEELALYASVTEDSTTIVSYAAWANASTWSAQEDAHAVSAGLWTDNETINHGASAAGDLAGRTVYRTPEGNDSAASVMDWAVTAAADTYQFTEGWRSDQYDSDLTGISITLESMSGSSDTVALGETLAITLTATGGGAPNDTRVTTVLVTSNGDPAGIVVNLVSPSDGTRIYKGEITIFEATDTPSRDGMRWLGVSVVDTVTITWVKGGDQAITAVPGELDHFDLSAPGRVNNDVAFTLTIEAVTVGNARKTDYTGTVDLTIFSGSISPTSATFGLEDSGIKNVTVTISGAALGTDTITATESVTGETGVVAVRVVEVGVVINEILAKPAAIDWDGSTAVSSNADEWVELFNVSNSPVELTNWNVGELSASGVTLSDTIEGRGYLTIYRQTAGNAIGYFFDSAGVHLRTVNPLGAGALGPLTDGGGQVVLKDNLGDTVDEVTYPAAVDDRSYVRAWDGAGVFRGNVKPTPGITPTPATANESSPNMRFQLELLDTAALNSSFTLRVTAVDAEGVTVTGFDSLTAAVDSSGGPSLSVTSLTFTNGVFNDSVQFTNTTGTAVLTVTFETNTIGSDTIVVEAAVGNADFTLSKTIVNITLSGVSSAPVPGASVLYELSYENIGPAASDTAIIRDSVPLNSVLSGASREADTLGASAVFDDSDPVNGWQLQHSTLAAPDQSSTSADYLDGLPGDLSTVRWIRWRRSSVASGESATIRFRAILE